MAVATGHHAVGYSVFALAVIAIAGALAANHVLLAGVEATNSKRSQAVQAIASVYERTRHWPANDRDAILTESDRSRLRAMDATFRLDTVEPSSHRALYFVKFGERNMRVGVPERM